MEIIDIVKSENFFKFSNDFKALLNSNLKAALESRSLKEEFSSGEEISMGEEEADLVLQLKASMRGFGAVNDFSYEEGILSASFTSKNAVGQAADYLDTLDKVESYEIVVFTNGKTTPVAAETDIDWESVTEEGGFTFDLIIYLNPEFVTFNYYSDDINETEQLDEIVRKVKINFRGKRRIKMQCRPGFRYNPSSKTCEKISGQELAQSRIAHRKAVLNKRSQGSAFQVRVNRKTAKANRFRKMQGLG